MFRVPCPHRLHPTTAPGFRLLAIPCETCSFRLPRPRARHAPAAAQAREWANHPLHSTANAARRMGGLAMKTSRQPPPRPPGSCRRGTPESPPLKSLRKTRIFCFVIFEICLKPVANRSTRRIAMTKPSRACGNQRRRPKNPAR